MGPVLKYSKPVKVKVTGSWVNAQITLEPVICFPAVCGVLEYYS
jgi:hypothetical protein